MSTRWLLRAREHGQRLRDECVALMTWWLHEMQEIIADIQQRIAPGRPQRTTISLSDSAGTVTQHWRSGVKRTATFSRMEDGGLPEDRSACWPSSDSDSGAVHVVLPRSAVLMRSLWLPAGAARNLKSVIELEMDRELPLPRDEVRADWHIEAFNRDRTKISVALAIVRRAELESLFDALNRWKLRVLSVCVALDAERTAFNFAPRRLRRSDERLTASDRALLISAVAVLVAFIGIVGAQWLRERYVIGEAIVRDRPSTLRVERMLTEIGERQVPVKSLQQHMASPLTAEALADLTAAIPHENWVLQLEIDCSAEHSCSMRLSAVSPAATALVDSLVRSGHFDNVELRSAVASGPGHERAELLARWLQMPTKSGAEATVR